ncbi:TMV resistance protein [Nymphaea thermarum]|nr:TMV resistance protein [Nymphaea thermarum]
MSPGRGFDGPDRLYSLFSTYTQRPPSIRSRRRARGGRRKLVKLLPEPKKGIKILILCHVVLEEGNKQAKGTAERVYTLEGEMGASSSSTKFEFDVFLSFRGTDTRKGFTGHLYDRLVLHGVYAFMDSEGLEKGQDIEQLLKYINRSMIFMPIFSKGYAESRWCLKEISMMVACGRLIIPVFFDVEPVEVRDQIGQFASAFERYERDANMDQQEVSNWRRALRTVGELSGFHLKNDTNGNEAELINRIVKRLLSEVRKLPFLLPQHLIGVDAHVQKVKELLSTYCRTVQFIGIHGIGGMGKTTIAKAIYNDLFLEFQNRSFLFDIREKYQQHRELELQRQLAREILKIEDPGIYSVEHGKSIIKKGMKNRRELIILDDVDDKYQVDALAGGSDWFGQGSVILITTRNKKVLKECGLGEGQIYKVNGLNHDQSCDLLKWHAFKGREPENGCRQLLDEFVKGKTSPWIPLALEVIGSTLYQSEVQDWEHEERQKQIFLDISCFFIGKDREKATHMWKACDWCPERVIPDLRRRSLIDIDQHGEFSMHDLIRDMGREIVREEAPENDDSWKRSRLWRSQDIFNLLWRKLTNVSSVLPRLSLGFIFLPLVLSSIVSLPLHGLPSLTTSQTHHPFAFCSSFVLLLTCLLPGVVFGGYGSFLLGGAFGKSATTGYSGTPSHRRSLWHAVCREMFTLLFGYGAVLRLLLGDSTVPINWRLVLENCVFTSLPHDFDIEKVAVLDLSGCSRNMAECLTNNSSTGKRVIQRWSSFFFSLLYHLPSFPNQKVLSNLKFLSFARTEISSTPDFTNVHCLEQLILSDCTKLTEVHESIGLLKSLLSLDLGGCEILSKIPDIICELSSLKSFDLHRCAKVSSLPERLGNLTSLEKLYLDMTSIEMLPDSIGSLTSLQVLSLKQCKLKTMPASLRNLLCLQHLIIQGTFVNGLPNDIYYEEESVELRASSIEFLAVLPNLLCRRICILYLKDHSYTTKELPDSMKHMINLSSLDLYCKMLRALPTYIGSLRRIKRLRLDCMGLQSLLDLYCKMLRALPTYIGSLRRIKRLRLDCMGLQSLPDSFGELRELETFEIVSKILAALPDSLGELESLRVLLVECSKLTSLPHSIGHLENLRTLLLSCHDLKDFPASISYLGRLKNLLLIRCHNLNELSVAPISQQDRLHPPFSTKKPERSGHGSLQQLGPSLLYLEASYCTQLRKVNISGFRPLLHLDLRGSVLLEEIDGLENISNNLESLVLPPTCAFSDNFNERHFKILFNVLLTLLPAKQTAAFPRLHMFAVSDGTTDIPRSPFFPGDVSHRYACDFVGVPTPPESRMLWVRRGHLPFLLPNVPHTKRCLSRAQFNFNGLPSPVWISVVADGGFLVFETTRQLIGCSLKLESNDEIILRLRDIASATIKVTADMSKLSEVSASFEWETSLPLHFSFRTLS